LLTAGQLRAARALLGVDQKEFADKAGVSVQTIQRMEASDGIVRGVAESLMKVIQALDRAGIELIAEGTPNSGKGRGVRLKVPPGR
jgi:DNA-binding transcriptional regulator YiaG